MSDGITLYCPNCGGLKAVKKEYDKLKVKLRVYELKHLGDEDWYDSSLPVYTCQSCEQQWVMERVNK